MALRVKRRQMALVLLLALALVRGVIYGAVIPPWQAPDEPRHLEYVLLLKEKRRLLTHEDLSLPIQKEIITSMVKYEYWRFGYARFPFDPDKPPQSFAEIYWPVDPFWLFHPPTYYMLGALVLYPIAQADVAIQLYILRLVSVLLGASVVGVACLTIQALFPDDDFLMVGVPVFVAFLPAHTFLTSTVNSDHLAELFVSLLILVLVRSFKDGLFPARLAASVLLLILALLSKRTALVGIPLTVVALLLYFWRNPPRLTFGWRHVSFGIGVSVLGLSIAVLFWDVWRPLLTAQLVQFTDWLPAYAALIVFRRGDYLGLLASEGGNMLISFGHMMFETFWARFGWLNVRLDGIWYQALALVTMATVGGMVLFAGRALKKTAPLAFWQKKCLLLFFLAAVSAVAIVVIYRVSLSAYYLSIQLTEVALPQGRYLFPVIVPIATLFVLGLRELAPVRYRKLWLVTCVSGLVMLDAVSLLGYIIPFFYG